MKIHTDHLTSAEVYAATKAGGMKGVYAECVTVGSRSRKRGLVVHLVGNSGRRPNPGKGGTDKGGYAATWDEWGMFLNYLFEMDPDAIATGACAYEGRDEFLLKTDWRFTDLTADEACKNHKWEYTGTPRENTCKKCEAVRRF